MTDLSGNKITGNDALQLTIELAQQAGELASKFLKYPQFKRKITFYPYTAKKMTDEYLTLFTELVGKRKEIIKNRNLFRKPSLLIKNFLLVFLKINNIVQFLKKMYSKRIMK